MDLSKATFQDTSATTVASACATTSSSCPSTISPTPHVKRWRPHQGNARDSASLWALQFGADLELHFKTLIGTGSNPNVAAVVVIGIEDGWAKRVADGIAATGKPVSFFGIEGHGDMETIRRASKAAKDYMHWASELRREERSLKICGCRPSAANRTRPPASAQTPAWERLRQALRARRDARVRRNDRLTGGEQLVAARCRTPEVRDKFMFMFNRYQEVIDSHKTSDLMDSQPTKGNIAGGLTTIEEKALGNIQKIGRKCMVDGVLDKAEVPSGPACGSWIPPRPRRKW